MIANSRQKAATQAIVALIGTFWILVAVSAVAMPDVNCFAFASCATPIYLGTHRIATAVGRVITRDRLTAGWFVLCAFALIWVCYFVPGLAGAIMGYRPGDRLLAAIGLACAGAAVAYVQVGYFDGSMDSSDRPLPNRPDDDSLAPSVPAEE